MTKFVIDTNVIVSAAMSPNGEASRIIRLFLDGEIDIYYSIDTLAEYEDVLSREYLNIPVETQKEYLDMITIHGALINPDVSDIYIPDEDDRIFYDVATKARATVVTYNIKDFPDESFIITPTQCITELERLKELERQSIFFRADIEYDREYE